MNRRHLTFSPAAVQPTPAFPESINFSPALMHTMPTLSETLAILEKAGYTENFNPHGEFLAGQRSAIQLAPDEFVVDNHYRFEGPTDPADEAVLYAISSPKFNLKGTLVNGYGVSSEPVAAAIIQSLRDKTA